MVDFKQGLKIHPVVVGNALQGLSFFDEMGLELKLLKRLQGLEVFQKEILLPEWDFNFIFGFIGWRHPSS